MAIDKDTLSWKRLVLMEIMPVVPKYIVDEFDIK